MQLRSQRPLHVQGDAGYQGDGPEKNNRKKWRAEEEERHKGSLTTKKNSFKTLNLSKNVYFISFNLIY
jgi:cytochrome c biogenesis protein ResB